MHAFARFREANYSGAVHGAAAATAKAAGVSLFSTAAATTAAGLKDVHQKAVVAAAQLVFDSSLHHLPDERSMVKLGLLSSTSGTGAWTCNCSCIDQPHHVVPGCYCNCSRCKRARQLLCPCAAHRQADGSTATCSCPPACSCCCPDCDHGAAREDDRSGNTAAAAAAAAAPSTCLLSSCSRKPKNKSHSCSFCSEACYEAHCKEQQQQPLACANKATGSCSGSGISMPGNFTGSFCEVCYKVQRSVYQAATAAAAPAPSTCLLSSCSRKPKNKSGSCSFCSEACYEAHCKQQQKQPRACANKATGSCSGSGISMPGTFSGRFCDGCFSKKKSADRAATTAAATASTCLLNSCSNKPQNILTSFCSEACYEAHCKQQQKQPRACANKATGSCSGSGISMPGSYSGRFCDGCFKVKRSVHQPQQQQQQQQQQPSVTKPLPLPPGSKRGPSTEEGTPALGDLASAAAPPSKRQKATPAWTLLQKAAPPWTLPLLEALVAARTEGFSPSAGRRRVSWDAARTGPLSSFAQGSLSNKWSAMVKLAKETAARKTATIVCRGTAGGKLVLPAELLEQIRQQAAAEKQ